MGRALARAAGVVSLALMAAQAAQAQQVISAIESDWDLNGDQPFDTDKQFTFTPGQALATTLGGTDARAMTDFGINRIAAAGTAEYKTYATSSWLDSFVVGGEAGTMVNLTFTINVHGGTTGIGPSGDHAYNFKLYALRGDGWAMSGQDYDEVYQGPRPYGYSPAGDAYERLTFTQTRADGSISQMDGRDFGGFYNYGPSGNGVGAFTGLNNYDATTDTYSRIFFNGPNEIEQRFGPQIFQQFTNGNLTTTIPYAALPENHQLRLTRAAFVNNYSMIGMAQFCNFADNECGDLQTSPEGLNLTLNFSLMAGSTFTLAGYLFADDFFEGRADFYHTAKMTGISVSQGGSLTSASGTLVDLGNGQYGYAAVLAAGAVPEPTTWALLILGFGFVGGAMRRQGTARTSRAAMRIA